MNFNSAEFLIFYPIVLLLHFLLPIKFRWVALLAVSYYFYMTWNPSLIFLILFTTVVSWVCSLVIEKSQSKATRRACLVITLIICLGVLFFFKYYNFIASSVSGIMTLFGAAEADFTLNLILPVGISFYTFQTLSYAIDVYRGDIKTERHFGYYALFVSFFPQLVAGPIERPQNLLPQLHTKQYFNTADASAGLKRMMVGFFKKVVVADLLAVYVNTVYNDAANASAVSVILASVMFAVQIYCDFSGYTDIAIGCARVMGIKLMQNFNLPYSARSIKEFWNRWHISLSSWFRDYLYFPLGGSRCAKPRHLFNLMVVFLVSGLWHGAAWTFVIWGFLHGAYQVVGILTKNGREALCKKLGLNRDSKGYHAWQTVCTFMLVTFAWIFFRANSMSDLGTLMSKLVTAWNVPLTDVFASMGLTLRGALISILSIVVLIYIDRFVKHDETPNPDGTLNSTAAVNRGKAVIFTWAIAIAWLALLAGDGASSFIYFQF